MRKRWIFIILILFVAIIAGFFVPLGEYTKQNGVCPEDNPPKIRLHYVSGDRLEIVRETDIEIIGQGCARQVTYVLYFL